MSAFLTQIKEIVCEHNNLNNFSQSKGRLLKYGMGITFPGKKIDIDNFYRDFLQKKYYPAVSLIHR